MRATTNHKQNRPNLQQALTNLPRNPKFIPILLVTIVVVFVMFGVLASIAESILTSQTVSGQSIRLVDSDSSQVAGGEPGAISGQEGQPAGEGQAQAGEGQSGDGRAGQAETNSQGNFEFSTQYQYDSWIYTFLVYLFIGAILLIVCWIVYVLLANLNRSGDKVESQPAEVSEVETDFHMLRLNVDKYISLANDENALARKDIISLREYNLQISRSAIQFRKSALRLSRRMDLFIECNDLIDDLMFCKDLEEARKYRARLHRLAAQVEDQTASELLLTDLEDADHWNDAARYINALAGVYRDAVIQYRNYATDLMESVINRATHVGHTETDLEFRDDVPKSLRAADLMDNLNLLLSNSIGQFIKDWTVPETVPTISASQNRRVDFLISRGPGGDSHFLSANYEHVDSGTVDKF